MGPTPPLTPQLPRAIASSQNAVRNPQAAVKNEKPEEPRVPLSYYLTQADQLYPDSPASWANSENFLILGTDKRAQDPIWRTDVIMLVGLNRATGRAAILSVPRDLYVDIPGTVSNRINTVDYMGQKILRVEGGGAALVSQVVRKNFGIKIDHWVRIQMDGLGDLVDAVGGVTVNLECPFFEPILNLDTNQWEYFTLPAGEVTMDGDTARWFVRLRLRESDFGRAKRQRQFLGALQEKVLSSNAILQLPELWGTMNEIYDTDMGLLEIMGLVSVAITLDKADIRSGSLSGNGGALENYKTAQGAQVIRLKNESAMRSILEDVWHNAGEAEAAPRRESCPPVPLTPPRDPYAKPLAPSAPQPQGEGVQLDASG